MVLGYLGVRLNTEGEVCHAVVHLFKAGVIYAAFAVSAEEGDEALSGDLVFTLAPEGAWMPDFNIQTDKKEREVPPYKREQYSLYALRLPVSSPARIASC